MTTREKKQQIMSIAKATAENTCAVPNPIILVYSIDNCAMSGDMSLVQDTTGSSFSGDVEITRVPWCRGHGFLLY